MKSCFIVIIFKDVCQHINGNVIYGFIKVTVELIHIINVLFIFHQFFGTDRSLRRQAAQDLGCLFFCLSDFCSLYKLLLNGTFNRNRVQKRGDLSLALPTRSFSSIFSCESTPLKSQSTKIMAQIEISLVADRRPTGNKTRHGQGFCHELCTAA